MKTLERAVLAGARRTLKNPKLTMGQLMEWSTSEELVRKNLQSDEVAVRVPDPGVWIAVEKKHDRRAS